MTSNEESVWVVRLPDESNGLVFRTEESARSYAEMPGMKAELMIERWDQDGTKTRVK